MDVDAPEVETQRGRRMRTVRRILVIQTAFIGDVILTLPLIQVLKQFFADAAIDVVVVPRSAAVCRNHPSINQVIEYDKRGSEKGVANLVRFGLRLRKNGYDLAIVPHRSIRSGVLAFLAGPALRIGFKRSMGRFLMTKTVLYKEELHEVERNLSLLGALGIKDFGRELPRVFPGSEEAAAVDDRLAEAGIPGGSRLVAIAPGTVWNTKRWLKDRFALLAQQFVAEGFTPVLVGGPEDNSLCSEIMHLADSDLMANMAGKLSLLESAELIRRCVFAVSNDSAPMHLAVAVGTPVVAIFGATVPQFGFAPYGPNDAVVEVRGLSCRPCSIHGGPRCPIKTFVCMKNITHDRVFAKAMDVLERAQSGKLH